MNMKSALITGITGQDGSYLAEFLLAKNYEVHGLVRRSSSFNTQRLSNVYKNLNDCHENIHLHYGDLSDSGSITNLIREIQPNEIYNLGAQSHVQVSFEVPQYTASVDGVSPIMMLEAIRSSGNPIRFYQASTSEIFGSTPPPQNELTEFRPRSPYGAAKLMAYWNTVNYRIGFDLFSVNGILFNHESPRRGESFVTRKISKAVAEIASGKKVRLRLGNLNAIRDWGYAKEYVESMWLMLQQNSPSDYVIATGIGATVKEFVEAAFEHVNLDWRQYVETDSRYVRPTEVDALIGDYSKAKIELGWAPKTLWKDLVKIMVDADLESLNNC